MSRKLYRRLTFASIMIFFSGIIVFFSCQKFSKQESPVSQIKYSQLNILGKSYDAQNISKSSSLANSRLNINDDLQTTYAEIANGGVSTLVSDLKNNIVGDVNNIPSNVYMIILYSSEVDSKESKKWKF